MNRRKILSKKNWHDLDHFGILKVYLIFNLFLYRDSTIIQFIISSIIKHRLNRLPGLIGLFEVTSKEDTQNT